MCPHLPYVLNRLFRFLYDTTSHVYLCASWVDSSYVVQHPLCALCGSNISNNLPNQANNALTTSSIFPH